MAKFKGQLVIIEETNLTSLFYYQYLCKSYYSEVKYSPIQYYDSIDKKGIDLAFNDFIDSLSSEDIPKYLDSEIINTKEIILEITKTVSHGYKFNIIQDNVTDEGLINKLKAVESKKIKNYTKPYNGIFKKYSVHTYNS
jgi:hypothetical protein